MADSEKLTALKKAYADIILNTAKEAAARIMVSERKAQRYQRELFAAKDEALRMLLRLKQMLDSKVTEAEMSSLNQQRRIDELEAQLGEAEDIVKDLRSELRELQDELEKATKRQILPLDEQNFEGQKTSTLTAAVENKINSPGSLISSLPSSHCDPVLSPETENFTTNGTHDDNKCYSGNDCSKGNGFICNPDFDSIVMRSQEPELYRNGCTQRIRAFESSLLGGNLSLSGQADGVKNQVFMIEAGEDKDAGKQLTSKFDHICDAEKLLDSVKGNGKKYRKRKHLPVPRQADGLQSEIFNREAEKDKYICIPRILRRKRADRYRRHRTYKTSTREGIDNSVKSEKYSRTIDNTSLRDPLSHVVPKSPSFSNEVATQLESLGVTESEAEFGGTCSVQDKANHDAPINELDMARQDAGSSASSEFAVRETNIEISSVLPSNSKPKELYKTEAVSVPMQPLYKYTFQRKRKKESLSSPDGDASLSHHTLKRTSMEKQSGYSQSDNSGLITESSRDSRRLAQVARQLISLSEKQWK